MSVYDYKVPDYDALRNEESPVTDHMRVPRWIEQDIGCNTVGEIARQCRLAGTREMTKSIRDGHGMGGCITGCYMPAVEYYTAMKTMTEHGDDVIEFTVNFYGGLMCPPGSDDPQGEAFSWSVMACHFMSLAVDGWCVSIAEELEACLQKKHFDLSMEVETDE